MTRAKNDGIGCVDGHDQAPVVVRVLAHVDRRPGAGDVPVLLGLGQGGRLGVRCRSREVVGQPDDAGQGRGIGGALDPERVRPVPAHVDDDRHQAHEREHRAGEDDDDLAARAAAGGRLRARPAGSGTGSRLASGWSSDGLDAVERAPAGAQDMPAKGSVANIPAGPCGRPCLEVPVGRRRTTRKYQASPGPGHAKRRAHLAVRPSRSRGPGMEWRSELAAPNGSLLHGYVRWVSPRRSRPGPVDGPVGASRRGLRWTGSRGRGPGAAGWCPTCCRRRRWWTWTEA